MQIRSWAQIVVLVFTCIATANISYYIISLTLSVLVINPTGTLTPPIIINPRRMREGYGSRFVCVCVCVSVTELAATYLVYSLKVRCH